MCGAQCGVGYDDAEWELIDAPHDYIVTLPITNATTNSEASGFFPRANAVYRKHFVLPADWEGDYIHLRFEGVYKVAYCFLNGVFAMLYGGTPARGNGGSSGGAYTDFSLRLDNQTSVTYGSAAPNTLALFVDGSYGTEHWYAGAGLYRSVHLVRTSQVHLDAGSLYFVSTPDMSARSVSTSTIAGIAGSLSAPAIVASSVTVVNDGDAGSGGGAANVTVTLQVRDANGALVAEGTAGVGQVAAGGGTITLRALVLRIARAALWTVQAPHLYTTVCSIADARTGRVLDAVNTTIGVRSTRWDVNQGFFLNDQNIKIRGFCHHDDFTSVGMAVPDRIWLLRAQQNRGVGANAWRTSHNNYRASVYDIADATGTLVYDENRDLREAGLQAMGKMIRAHRNHPAIVAYSLCNEGECDAPGPHRPHNTTVYAQFRNLTKRLDPSRAVSGNMFAEYGPGTLTDFLDLQGISHPNMAEIDGIRSLKQQRPLIVSECCSCESERGEDQGTATSGGYPAGGLYGKSYPGFNADCLQREVNMSDSLPYVAGTMIWTLGDYIGESLEWPAVSSSFGAVDLAGFPKAGAHWFAAWWLQSDGPLSSASRPPLPFAATVHIVESNEPRSSDPHISRRPGSPAAVAAAANATFHVYSSASAVELFVNGASAGEQPNTEWMGWTAWNVTWAAGNVTAAAKDASGKVVAVHSRFTAGAAAAIALQLDAPSASTATGHRVVLDGHDVALVRATVVDARRNTVPTSAANITFERGTEHRGLECLEP
eukprot:g2119.t1